MTRPNLKKTLGALAATVALAVPAVAGAASLEVDEQITIGADANTSITVPSATLDAPGYVVIHEGTETSFGDVIGVSEYSEAGTYTDMMIELDREIVDDEYLWVMVHTENNENTTYDGATIDLPVVDEANGNAMFDGVVTFPVQVNVEAQTGTDATFDGEIADMGVSLVLFTGGSMEDLVAAAEAEGVLTIAATVDGEFLTYVVGAPTFVNAEFSANFEAGVDADTPLVLVKR